MLNKKFIDDFVDELIGKPIRSIRIKYEDEGFTYTARGNTKKPYLKREELSEREKGGIEPFLEVWKKADYLPIALYKKNGLDSYEEERSVSDISILIGIVPTYDENKGNQFMPLKRAA